MTTATKKRGGKAAGRKRGGLPSDAEKFRQQYIDGTEPVRIPHIERLTDNYMECRDLWQEYKDAKAAAEEALVKALQDENLETYNYDGVVVKAKKGKDKVIVRREVKDAKDSENNGEVEGA